MNVSWASSPHASIYLVVGARCSSLFWLLHTCALHLHFCFIRFPFDDGAVYFSQSIYSQAIFRATFTLSFWKIMFMHKNLLIFLFEWIVVLNCWTSIAHNGFQFFFFTLKNFHCDRAEVEVADFFLFSICWRWKMNTFSGLMLSTQVFEERSNWTKHIIAMYSRS